MLTESWSYLRPLTIWASHQTRSAIWLTLARSQPLAAPVNHDRFFTRAGSDALLEQAAEATSATTTVVLQSQVERVPGRVQKSWRGSRPGRPRAGGDLDSSLVGMFVRTSNHVDFDGNTHAILNLLG